MKCSLKGSFIGIFLITAVAPSRGLEYPVLVGRRSEPMDFQQFRARINRLEYYDSFPGDGDSENQLHKIVKKQMAVSDYKDMRKNKRSISEFPDSFGKGDGDRCERESHAKKRSAINPVSQMKQTPKGQPRSIWRKASSGAADTRGKAEASQPQPKNKSTRWFGHEVRHRRGDGGGARKGSRSAEAEDRGNPKRGLSKQSFDNSDDPDPANEWLDASKGGANQKVPAEFRPKKKPRLKIYHLRVKRRPEHMLQNNIIAGHRGMASAHVSENHRKAGGTVRGIRPHGTRHELPRSFVIRINKKYGKENQEEKIAEGEENEEEDEEGEEEEDDEEDSEDEDEAEEEEELEAKQGDSSGASSHKDSFKDLLRSAKAAVTNRVRFTEAPGASETGQKTGSRGKGKKSESGYSSRGKKVLIDANIKVDSALSDVLRNILKTTGMVSCRRGGPLSEGELSVGLGKDPELSRPYERLSRNNPRFRRSRTRGH